MTVQQQLVRAEETIRRERLRVSLLCVCVCVCVCVVTRGAPDCRRLR